MSFLLTKSQFSYKMHLTILVEQLWLYILSEFSIVVLVYYILTAGESVDKHASHALPYNGHLKFILRGRLKKKNTGKK